MKSIKTTFIRGLSLLLALVIVLNLPISAFAGKRAMDCTNCCIFLRLQGFDLLMEIG